jgi:hypothetical protein
MTIVRKTGLAAAGLGLALLAGSTSRSFAASAPNNMNLRLSGYAVLTPTAGTPAQADIEGLGQLTATTTGVLAGALTYSAVSAAAATEDVCNGTVAGTITPPSGAFASGNGEFTITLNFTPSTSSTGTDCISSTATLLCNRTLAHPTLASNLGAGDYRCIATNVTAGTGATATVNAASLHADLNVSRGSNAPTS